MIGTKIGNYTIASLLGRGGMGEVFLAHTRIGTRVAIKMLDAGVSQDEGHVQRFFNEALATEKIAHSGICKIHDVGHHADRAYLVMEFLNGETLGHRIRRLGRLSSTQIGVIGSQITSVLAATHRAGIIHRDLKPENIFIIPDEDQPSGERVKVLDFGIAKLTGTLAAGAPKTSGTMGTATYMAPEQWTDSSSVDWRVDVYSLGCVVFEMACGRPPFVVPTIGEACAKHLGVIPPTARSLVPDVPGALDALLARLLAKQPDARPSMKEIRAVFDELGSQRDPVGPTLMSIEPHAPPVATLPLTTPLEMAAVAADRGQRAVAVATLVDGAPPRVPPTPSPPPEREPAPSVPVSHPAASPPDRAPHPPAPEPTPPPPQRAPVLHPVASPVSQPAPPPPERAPLPVSHPAASPVSQPAPSAPERAPVSHPAASAPERAESAAVVPRVASRRVRDRRAPTTGSTTHTPPSQATELRSAYALLDPEPTTHQRWIPRIVLGVLAAAVVALVVYFTTRTRIDARVECQLTGETSVACTVRQTTGHADVEVCWDVSVACPGTVAAFVNAPRTCQRLAAGATTSTAITLAAPFACGVEPTVIVDNIGVRR